MTCSQKATVFPGECRKFFLKVVLLNFKGCKYSHAIFKSIKSEVRKKQRVNFYHTFFFAASARESSFPAIGSFHCLYLLRLVRHGILAFILKLLQAIGRTFSRQFLKQSERSFFHCLCCDWPIPNLISLCHHTKIIRNDKNIM